jgi:hypothetical protein
MRSIFSVAVVYFLGLNQAEAAFRKNKCNGNGCTLEYKYSYKGSQNLLNPNVYSSYAYQSGSYPGYTGYDYSYGQYPQYQSVYPSYGYPAQQVNMGYYATQPTNFAQQPQAFGNAQASYYPASYGYQP